MSDVLPENDRREPYTATDGQDEFGITFSITEAAEVQVFQNGAELVLTDDYAVDLAALTVTLATAAAADDLIIVQGKTPIKRAENYPRRGGLDTTVLNGEFDRIVNVLQEFDRDAGRTLTFNPAEAEASSGVLPVFQPAHFLGINAAGDGFEFYEPASFSNDIDIILTGLASGEFLQWDGSAWRNVTIDASVADNSLSNAKFAQVSTATIKGRRAGVGTGNVEDLNASQVRTIVGNAAEDQVGLVEKATDAETTAGVTGKYPDAAQILDLINTKLAGYTTIGYGFETSALTITPGSTLTVAHDLDYTPRKFGWYLKCITADGNYEVDDEVRMFSDFSENANSIGGFALQADDDNLYITFGSRATWPIIDEGDGTLHNGVLSRWKLYVQAE